VVSSTHGSLSTGAGQYGVALNRDMNLVLRAPHFYFILVVPDISTLNYI
jgi:hypothetical protein